MASGSGEKVPLPPQKSSGTDDSGSWELPYCSICRSTDTQPPKKEDTQHKTARCPFMALATHFDGSRDVSPTQTIGGSSDPILDDKEKTAADLMKQRGLNLLRVTNHLDYSHESKLYHLFKEYGYVSHVYAPYEGGNGFVNFGARKNAEIALNKLKGSTYEGMILKIEWADKRPE